MHMHEYFNLGIITDLNWTFFFPSQVEMIIEQTFIQTVSDMGIHQKLYLVGFFLRTDVETLDFL